MEFRLVDWVPLYGLLVVIIWSAVSGVTVNLLVVLLLLFIQIFRLIGAYILRWVYTGYQESTTEPSS